MQTRTLAIAFACGATAILVAGCGGSSGGASDPKTAANDYLKAITSGDYKRACDDSTARVKQAIQRPQPGKSCPDALATELKPGGPLAPFAARLKGVRVSSVKTTGNIATATANVPSLGPVPINLMKEGGKWKVAESSLG